MTDREDTASASAPAPHDPGARRILRLYASAAGTTRKDIRSTVTAFREFAVHRRSGVSAASVLLRQRAHLHALQLSVAQEAPHSPTGKRGQALAIQSLQDSEGALRSLAAALQLTDVTRADAQYRRAHTLAAKAHKMAETSHTLLTQAAGV